MKNVISQIMLLAFLVFPLNAFSETEDKSSLWLMSLTRFKFENNIRAFLDIQPRLAIDDSDPGEDGEFDTLLLRGAFGYQLTENVGLYQGYALIPTFDPDKVENRFFQELLISQKINQRIKFAHRFRFEQRLLEGVEQVSFRGRYFFRGVVAIPEVHKDLSIAINEEIFIHTNDADDGPSSGFNQNRTFLGLNYKINDSLAIDFGYQNQYVEGRKGNKNSVNHIAFLGFISSFSFMD